MTSLGTSYSLPTAPSEAGDQVLFGMFFRFASIVIHTLSITRKAVVLRVEDFLSKKLLGSVRERNYPWLERNISAEHPSIPTSSNFLL